MFLRLGDARDAVVERAVGLLTPGFPSAADQGLHARKDALIEELQNELVQLRAHLEEKGRIY